MKIGLISDTHGVIDPAVTHLFGGTDVILHAGDWGDYGLLADLAQIAPVHSVRGNLDAPDAGLPKTLTTEIGGLTVHLRHKVKADAKEKKKLATHSGADLIVYGHTHAPAIEHVTGTLFVNPGSANATRSNPPTAGLLVILDGTISVTIHNLRDPDLQAFLHWP